jgi:hypothetical protein
VVDDRALVVGPEQHDVSVEGEEIVWTEAADLPVREPLSVADHAAQVSFGREHAAHRGGL